MEIDKEQLKGHLDTIILITLKDESLYGYELSKRITSISNNLFKMKESTLYIILKRLERDNLIYSYWSDDISNGGRRKYNRITQQGIEYLEKKHKEWIFLETILNNFYGRI